MKRLKRGSATSGNPKAMISAKDLAETDCRNLARGLARLGPAVNEAFTSIRARPRLRAALEGGTTEMRYYLPAVAAEPLSEPAWSIVALKDSPPSPRVMRRWQTGMQL